MSSNCIQCISNKRTGTDLLCDECRYANKSVEYLPYWIFPIKRLVISDQVGQWCRIPYPGHPKGCPNYGWSKKCPPEAPPVDEFFDLSKPLWFVHSEFNVADHILRMEKKYPEWSLNQCRCVLYWQQTSRKQLKERVKEAFLILNVDSFTLIPEAMGVNVYATARLVGLKLERIRHMEWCRHVALLGSRKFGQMSFPWNKK